MGFIIVISTDINLQKRSIIRKHSFTDHKKKRSTYGKDEHITTRNG